MARAFFFFSLWLDFGNAVLTFIDCRSFLCGSNLCNFSQILFDDLLSDFIWVNGFLCLRFAFAKAKVGVVAVYR
jgi:hypothetical protein